MLFVGGYLTNLLIGVFGGYQVCLLGCRMRGENWTAFNAAAGMPVVGPLLQLGLIPVDPGGWLPGLLAAFLAETVGVLLLVAGAAMPERASVELSPGAAGADLGATLLGRF